MKRTYYCVGGHLFAVECSSPALLSLMSNYEPFRQDNPSNDDTIFVLRIEIGYLLCEDERNTYTHIFTDNSEEDMPRIEVYKHMLTDNTQFTNWLLRVSMVANSPICCELLCAPDFTYGLLHIDQNCQDIRFCIDNALMLLYAFRSAPLMTLEMHAAVVVKAEDNKQDALAYLFLGHSGTGKSTHARQWLHAFSDAWLLNDDNPILRVMDNGEIRIYGSPWSGKTPCYKNDYARVGGIVKLTQAPHNAIRPISLPEAYAYMLSSVSGLKVETQMVDYLYNSIKHIITHIPCYLLECLPNTDAAEVCWKEVKENRP